MKSSPVLSGKSVPKIPPMHLRMSMRLPVTDLLCPRWILPIVNVDDLILMLPGVILGMMRSSCLLRD